MPVVRPIPPSAAWVAWCREWGKRWKQVGCGPTEAEAWRLLWLAMANAGPGHRDWVVLRNGEKP